MYKAGLLACNKAAGLVTEASVLRESRITAKDGKRYSSLASSLVRVLRGGAHCLPISLPDKPVAGRPVTGRALLLGYLGTIPHRKGCQRGCEGILGQHLYSATIDGLGC